MTQSSDAAKYMTELLNLKNTRIGKLVIELEETKKFLDRIRTVIPLKDRRILDKRMDSLNTVVNECIH